MSLQDEIDEELFDIVCRALCNSNLQEAHDIFEDAWVIRKKVSDVLFRKAV